MIRRLKLMAFNWFFARLNSLFWRFFINVFGITLSLLIGVIAGVSILGFAGIYQPTMGVLISLAIAVVVFYWLNRYTLPPLLKVFRKDKEGEFVPWMESLFIVIGILLLALLILVPVARWPNSYSGDWFVWDAGAYHFPKAIELYKSGTIWDLSIPYGEYPFGYEALLTFALSLSGSESLFGFIHVAIILLFFSSVLIIARKLTNLSPGFLLLLAVLMILSDNFFQVLNLWRIFTQDIYTVGKNDLMLAAAQLAMIVFAFHPLEKRSRHPWQLIGTTLAGMLALAIKPNSVFLVGPLLGLQIFQFVRRKTNAGEKNRSLWQREIWMTMLTLVVILLPGVLWLIRNVFAMGRPFSDLVLQLSDWSILANLTNPYLTHYIPKNLLVILAILLAGIVLSVNRQKKLRLPTLVYGLLLFAFISTPVSGFFLSTDQPARISWRFAETLLAFVFVYLLTLARRPLQKFIAWIRGHNSFGYGLSLLAVLVGGWLLLNQSDKLAYKPENAIILRDQYRESVGVRGYYSAYDFIQRNIRNSVVWVENALPYYVYGPGYTNTVSRNKELDYLLVLNTNWANPGEVVDFVPSFLNKEALEKNYALIYQDGQGSVYKRVH